MIIKLCNESESVIVDKSVVSLSALSPDDTQTDIGDNDDTQTDIMTSSTFSLDISSTLSFTVPENESSTLEDVGDTSTSTLTQNSHDLESQSKKLGIKDRGISSSKSANVLKASLNSPYSAAIRTLSELRFLIAPSDMIQCVFAACKVGTLCD